MTEMILIDFEFLPRFAHEPHDSQINTTYLHTVLQLLIQLKIVALGNMPYMETIFLSSECFVIARFEQLETRAPVRNLPNPNTIIPTMVLP